MDAPQWKLGCLEWAIIIALVVLVVIAGLIWIGPQIAPTFPCNCNNL